MAEPDRTSMDFNLKFTDYNCLTVHDDRSAQLHNGGIVNFDRWVDQLIEIREVCRFRLWQPKPKKPSHKKKK